MGRPKTIADDELLAIAKKIFWQYGHNATTRDVADAAGISQAVLYQRFKTKDQLFFAALAPPVAVLSALLEIDASTHEPRAYLAAFAAKARDHFRSVMPSILRIAAHPRHLKKPMDQIHQHNRAGEIAGMLGIRLQGWQEAGRIKPTNPRSFSHAFIHALHSMAMLDVLTGDTKTPTSSEEMYSFIDVFWDGLKPDAARPTSAKAKGAKRT